MTPQQLNKCQQKFYLSARRRDYDTELFAIKNRLPLFRSGVHGTAHEFLCPTICRDIVTNEVTLWSTSYSACVRKTIIQLSVGE